MKFIVVKTTDNQWLGLQFEFPTDNPLDMIGVKFPITEDIDMDIEEITQMPNGNWNISNPNYTAICRVVE